jgi:Tol biopolymer transport system component
VYDAGDGTVGAVAWYDRELLVASSIAGEARLQLIAMDGAVQASAPGGAGASYFHPSPSGAFFAYTASSAAGWRLFTVNAATLQVTDHGAMGADGPDGLPVPDAPGGGKGPMYIAWSVGGSRLAFGGGFDPPYSMTVLDLATGTTVRTPFASGYPGEIRWSPDGTQIAVSTYDTERTHHETWVVDPETGAGTHLMNGCIIVWSPDSRFLAVHGENVPGIAIVEAATGARMQLTANSTDAPLLWAE